MQLDDNEIVRTARQVAGHEDALRQRAEEEQDQRRDRDPTGETD